MFKILELKNTDSALQRKWDTDTIRANKPWLRSKSI
jgi:hypothetical protein